MRDVDVARGVVLGDVDREVAVGESVDERRGDGRNGYEGPAAVFVWRRGELSGSLAVKWTTIGCEMSRCRRRQRAATVVELGCYLGED